MDDNLKKALDFSNYMIVLDNQKRILKEQYQDNLVYYFSGGRFTVTQQLISFCQSLLSLDQSETILVDDNDIPVYIEDLKAFSANVVSVYWQATNKYLTEYNKLKVNRTVEGIFNE
jgi:hypothetical protein